VRSIEPAVHPNNETLGQHLRSRGCPCDQGPMALR
jgi:hypothetical protein